MVDPPTSPPDFPWVFSNSTRVRCPPHLPREYRCNTPYLPYLSLFLRYRNAGKGSLSCPSDSSPSKCVCIGPRSERQRWRGRIKGSSCICPDNQDTEKLTNWPIIRLTCCAEHSNEDVRVEHEYWEVPPCYVGVADINSDVRPCLPDHPPVSWTSRSLDTK